MKFSDSETKNNVLKKAKTLKNSSKYQRVYVNADLTPEQRKLNKDLRSELKRRKESGEDVVIYRNEIKTRQEIKNFQ